MKFKVMLFASFREICGERELALETDGPLTLEEALREAFGRCRGELEREVIEGDQVKDNVVIMVNGRNIKQLDDLKTIIRDGDEISIFPPVGGG
ncbi:MAG: ubiquitin-like small modifier protein 1 [Candidatus Bathyarchaeia archaeon]